MTVSVYLAKRRLAKKPVPPAFYRYEREKKAWIAANPDATLAERREALNSISKKIIGG